MSSTDLTEALTRLLSEPELRARFHQDRDGVAREISVAANDRPAFVALDACAVDRQAKGLIGKRFAAAASFMPRTIRTLGEPARGHFDTYATSHWPTGHQRHLKDAVGFCLFLADRVDGCVYWSELNWLRFVLSRHAFACHWVNDLVVNGRRRRAIQVFYRRGGVPRGFAWHLGSSRRSAE